MSKPEGCRVYCSVWLELCDACRVPECAGCLIEEAILLAGIVNSKQTEVLRASQPMPSGTTYMFVVIRRDICISRSEGKYLLCPSGMTGSVSYFRNIIRVLSPPYSSAAAARVLAKLE